MGSMCKTELGVVPRLFFCVLIRFKIEKILLVKEMSWVVRDENGGDRTVAPWPGDGTLIAHVNEDGTAHDYREPGHINFRLHGGNYNPHGIRGGITYEDGRAKYSPEKIQEMIQEGWLDPSVVENDMRSERIEVIPYSEEETNAKKQGLLNSFVDMIKRTGGKLMDRYQKNEAEKKEWRENNPGGYPGMPEHLRERMRRNQMSSIDGQQIAGYDPAFGDTFGSDDTDLNMAIPDPDRPTIYGSDVLDLLIQQEKVKNPSRSNNGWA